MGKITEHRNSNSRWTRINNPMIRIKGMIRIKDIWIRTMRQWECRIGRVSLLYRMEKGNEGRDVIWSRNVMWSLVYCICALILQSNGLMFNAIGGYFEGKEPK